MSERGQAVFKALRASRQALSETLLHSCDAETQAQLLTLLAQMRSHLEALDVPESSECSRRGQG